MQISKIALLAYFEKEKNYFRKKVNTRCKYSDMDTSQKPFPQYRSGAVRCMDFQEAKQTGRGPYSKLDRNGRCHTPSPS